MSGKNNTKTPKADKASNTKKNTTKRRSYAAMVMVFLVLLIVNIPSFSILGDYVETEIDKRKGFASTRDITEIPQNYVDVAKKLEKLSVTGISNDDTALKPLSVHDKNSEMISELFNGGIEKPDVLQTDGNFIYAVKNSRVYILSANGGQLGVVSETQREYDEETQNVTPLEIFVYKKWIVILNQVSDIDEVTSEQTGVRVEADIYDITDRAKPAFVSTVGQSGVYSTSRMIGDMLYLFTDYAVSDIDAERNETFVPMIYGDDKAESVAVNNICMYTEAAEAKYLVVSSFNVSDRGKFVSNKSLLGYDGVLYINSSNLYLASGKYKTDKNGVFNSTDITRLAWKDGQIVYKASANVPGKILDVYSMDEKNEYFRIVTTTNKYFPSLPEKTSDTETAEALSPIPSPLDVNCVYTLDGRLNIVGKLENIAAGEKVQSVRFFDSMVFIVTSGEKEHFLGIDLSNPADPQTVESLKFTGFTEFMHPYSNDMIFGFGKNDEDVGNPDFLKISMFDLRDIGDIAKTEELLLDGYVYAEGSYDPDAVIVDRDKKLVAFLAGDKYLVCSYDEDESFALVSEIPLVSDFEGYTASYYTASRVIYIDGYLYVITSDRVSSYNINNYRFVDVLLFEAPVLPTLESALPEQNITK